MSVKRPSLGRNLSALLSNPSPLLQTQSQTVIEVSIDKMQPGRWQPRKHFDEQSLQELSDSIKEQGILQPILVRPIDTERYEILAGERRFRAAQKAALHTVPVIVKHSNDQEALAIALIENLQREDLNPIEEAESIAKLVTDFDLTHQQVSELLGKSRSTISNLLRLQALAPSVKSFLRQGLLDMGHARCLLTLETSIQVKLAEKVVADGLSVRETERLMQVWRYKDRDDTALTEKSLKNNLSPRITQDIQRLAQVLQAKVRVQSGKAGKGALVINYDSEQALERLLGQLVE